MYIFSKINFNFFYKVFYQFYAPEYILLSFDLETFHQSILQSVYNEGYLRNILNLFSQNTKKKASQIKNNSMQMKKVA